MFVDKGFVDVLSGGYNDPTLLSEEIIEVTVGQFLDALEQNGLDTATGKWFELANGLNPLFSLEFRNESPIERACPLGQAAINLGVWWEDLRWSLRRFVDSSGGGADIAAIIMGMNDFELTVPSSGGIQKDNRYQEIVSFAKESLMIHKDSVLKMRKFTYNVAGK